MATSDQVHELRGMLGDSAAEDVETLIEDEDIARWIDSTTSIDAAAAKGWRYKMAQYADLVDVTDGAASRKLGDLIGHAALMIKMYDGLAEGPTSGRARVGKIVRSS